MQAWVTVTSFIEMGGMALGLVGLAVVVVWVMRLR
jgi:hypothetical protein